jgi:hypothetical protein
MIEREERKEHRKPTNTPPLARKTLHSQTDGAHSTRQSQREKRRRGRQERGCQLRM